MFLSNLLIKNLAIRVTTTAIAGDRFWKTEIPHNLFFLDILGIFGPNFKAIRQILIPYKFIQRWHTRVKPKSVFFASKGLETFHAFAAPYVNTDGCRQPIEMHESPSESEDDLCRIVFRRKLVCDMPSIKKSSRQKKTTCTGTAVGSTSAHPKGELHTEMRSF